MRALLEMDTFYTGYDFMTGTLHKDLRYDLPTGGVSDLLAVIGHCEFQIKCRMWESIRIAIQKMLNPDRTQLRRLTVSNYYEAVACGFGDAIQKAYDLYSNALPEEIEFWNDYRDRVNDAIEREFHVEFNLPSIRLPRKHVHKFNSNKHLLSEDIRTYIDATGDFPRFPAFNNPKVVQEYVFREVGALWEVAYEGEPINVPNLDGMHYIKALLESPKKEIRVDDLYRIVNPPKPLENGSGLADRDAIEEKFGPMSDFGSQIQDSADQGAIDHAKAKMQECLAELKRMVECGNQERVRELKDELDRYEAYLRQFADDKKRPRSVSDPFKRQRQAVSNAIKTALKKIEKVNPRLGSHLKLVVTGTNCVYKGDEPWKTQ
jgi:sugar-specific transcriptional regulator TrmB